MPTDDEEERQPKGPREVVIRDGTTFSFDLKTLLVLGGMAAGLAATTVRQEMALSSARYELQAEITRVENVGKSEQSAMRLQLNTIQDTLCALAKKQDVSATGCR